jgi:putative ABC transport system permease protein
MRAGLKGFRIFVLCLALGVAAIAGVGSLTDALVAGLAADGGKLLGGDVELRLTHREWTPAQEAYVKKHSRQTSSAIGLRTMARGSSGRALVELKGVDGAYPLYGTMRLAGGGDLKTALAKNNGKWGAVVEAPLVRRLGLKIGDNITIGELQMQLRAIIAGEPDRGGSGFTLGPRVMVAAQAMRQTGLIRLGSLVRYRYRILLPAGDSLVSWRRDLAQAFPKAGWRVRDLRNGAPGLKRFLYRMRLFLTLVGLSALLVGGLGVANGVKAFLDGKVRTIAILKCVGASGRLVFQVYLMQVMLIAAIGVVLGLLVGGLAPAALSGLLSEFLPFEAKVTMFGAPLALAALFGFLTALVFALWPLARTQEIQAGALFRDLAAPTRAWPKLRFLLDIGALALLLAGLAILTADIKIFALYFVIGAVGSMLAFFLAGKAIMWVAKSLPRFKNVRWRLAVANLHRPGAPTVSVALSFGLGLSVLVAVVAIRANISHLVDERLPKQAPAYFFLDILPNQVTGFKTKAEAVKGVGEVRQAPSLRGRIVSVKGVSADKIKPPAEIAWILRGDRGLTYAKTAPKGSKVVEGKWWPADYSGPPLVSIDVGAARGLGLKIGDKIGVNVLGREFEVAIANMRRIDWSTFGINFVLVFSPGFLEAAPHTFIATVMATPEAEAELEAAVTDSYRNVTAIRVRDALNTINSILENIDAAVRATAAITLVAGILVLSGAIAAGHRRRVFESVVLKVLGCTRREIMTTFFLEYALLGLVIGVLAAVVGSICAYFVVTEMMRGEWYFPPVEISAVVALSLVVTIILGAIATFAAHSQKAAPLLRNE